MGLLIVFYAKIITCGVLPFSLEEVCTVNFRSSMLKKIEKPNAKRKYVTTLSFVETITKIKARLVQALPLKIYQNWKEDLLFLF